MSFEQVRPDHWAQELRALSGVVTGEQWLWGLRMALLVLAVGFCLYAIFNLIANGARYPVAAASDAPSQQSEGKQQQLDAATVKGWAWFSEPKEEIQDVIEPPPVEDVELRQTRLALRLEGIVVGASPESSLAIIEVNGKADRYGIGAQLPVGRKVFLRAIMRHAVHLDNNGKLEELPLFTGDDLRELRKVARPAPAPLATGSIDKSADPQVVAMLGRYRQTLQRNPQAAARLLRYEVYIEDGQATGFKIGAAGNARDFARLGLQENDIVTHVNGVPLTDFSQSSSLLKQLDQLAEVNVQLIRRGQTQEIVYRLPDSN